MGCGGDARPRGFERRDPTGVRGVTEVQSALVGAFVPWVWAPARRQQASCAGRTRQGAHGQLFPKASGCLHLRKKTRTLTHSSPWIFAVFPQ